MNYLQLAAIFLTLGVAAHLIFRLWFMFLVRLSVSHDVISRRKIAAIGYPFVAVAFMAIATGSVLLSAKLIPHSPLITIGLLLALAPSMIWWMRKMSQLRTLGYGRQNQSRH